MKVLFSMQHPADVHFFRNAIGLLEEQGHEVRVLARENDVLGSLLEHYGIAHELVAGPTTGIVSLARKQVRYELAILRETRSFRPDVVAAVSEPAIAHAGTVTGTPSVLFSDTEHATIQNVLAYPFADRVVTPACYRGRIPATQVTYPGYHELAYLHPDRFTPETDVREEVTGDSERPLIVHRLVSWDAVHDVGNGGFTDPVAVVMELENAGACVRITAEGRLPSELRAYELDVQPHRMHDVLAAADLFLGEGATMAAESAVLGTPAVYVSTLELGYLEAIEARSGLVRNVLGPNRQRVSIELAKTLLDRDEAIWNRKRRRLVDACTDTTNVIVDQLESVVESTEYY
jgi:predicted glycosyltransferase